MVVIVGFAILIVLAALFGRGGIKWKRVAQLEIGMTATEVIKKVGKPYSITTFENGDEHWKFVEVAAKNNGLFSIIMRNGAAIKVPNIAALQAEARLEAEDRENRSKYLRWIAFVICTWIVVVVAIQMISNNKTIVASSHSTGASLTSGSQVVDCSAVTSETLKLICGTPALVKADLQLAKAYRKALSQPFSKTALRREQARWNALRDNAPADVSRLTALYKKRIGELKSTLPRVPIKENEAIEPLLQSDTRSETIQAEQSPTEPIPQDSTSHAVSAPPN